MYSPPRRHRAPSGLLMEDAVLEDGLLTGNMSTVTDKFNSLRGFFVDKRKQKNPTHELFRVVRAGDDKGLQKLLDRHPTPAVLVNTPRSADNLATPLHKAAKYGHSVCAFQLLFAGANINAKNSQGQTPFFLAVSSNHLDMIKFLLLQGADPNICENNSSGPLHTIANNGYYRALMTILEVLDESRSRSDPSRSKTVIGVDVNLQDREGMTPLHWCSVDRGAFRKNNSLIAKALLARGAEPNILNSQGETPLHSAAYYGAWELCGFLMRAGANPNQRNVDGKLPKDIAVQGLSMHLQIDATEKRMLESRIIAILRSEGKTEGSLPRNHPAGPLHRSSPACEPAVASSSEPSVRVKKREQGPLSQSCDPSQEAPSTVYRTKKKRRGLHRRNSSDTAVFEEQDRRRMVQFMQEQKRAIANQMALRIVFRHMITARDYVYLSFERSWNVEEAKGLIVHYLKIPDADLSQYSLLLPREGEKPLLLDDSALLSTYKLQPKDTLIFRDNESRSVIKSRRRNKRRSLFNAFTGLSKSQKQTLSTTGPSPSGPEEKEETFTTIKIRKRSPRPALHSAGFTSPPVTSRAVVKTPPTPKEEEPEPLHAPDSPGVDLPFTPPLQLPQESSLTAIHDEATLVVEPEDDAKFKDIEQAVAEATRHLKNQLVRCNNQLGHNRVDPSTLSDFPIEMPLNETGQHPSDCELWYPKNRMELNTMRMNGEAVELSGDGRRIQKLLVRHRIDDLLLHYRICLPPHFPFAEKVNILRCFVLYGEAILDQVYKSI